MSDLTQHDSWLNPGGPAAIVLREWLKPADAIEDDTDGIIFPPTFAAGESKNEFPGGYAIDEWGDGTNVCLIDTVGSQANRIEPMFLNEPYRSLVPLVTIKAGEKTVKLLEAGHRAGDAMARCSTLGDRFQAAFRAVLKGDAVPLAEIAPTSLVFGVWDSRGTQAKLPRLVSSTIRAFDVKKLTRPAQYNPPADYVAEGLLPEPDKLKVSDKAYGEHGFKHVPVTKPETTRGGIRAFGGIRRDAILSLSAVRLLAAGEGEGKTLALRRYILGLALVAFTARPELRLRQGCDLVSNSARPGYAKVVFGDGTSIDADLTHEAALKYAKAVAGTFGVGKDLEGKYEQPKAEKEIKEGKKKGNKKATEVATPEEPKP